MIYQKLIRLPLFIGMGKADLEDIIANTKFDFKKAEAGEVVAREGEKSGQLLLLVDGEISLATSSDDKSYTVTERIKAPASIQPETAFGLRQRYTSTITAVSTCNLICIGKTEVLSLTDRSLIFKLNLLNSLSTALQKRRHEAWRTTLPGMEHRITRFFLVHCLYPAGHKTFKITMDQLATELNTNRLEISKALHAMSDKGIIDISRGKIEIASIEKIAAAR